MTELTTVTVGTKETKEALIALVTIVDFLAERLKDGAGLDDLVAVYSKVTSDSIFMKKLKDGYEGIDKVSEELKDLKQEEIVMLGYEIAPTIIALLMKLKTK